MYDVMSDDYYLKGWHERMGLHALIANTVRDERFFG
jgi:hypothetical protein